MFDDRVYIIAEAGVNHNGNIDIAKQLISAAKEAGADCVKFQTWKTEELITEDAPKADYQLKNDGDGSQFEMLKKLELSYSEFSELKHYAEKTEIDFLSTPDELKSLNFLADELNLPIIKIGSGEISNLLFLKQIALKRKKVILSTGMSNLGDVEKAYLTLRNNGATEVALLHCTSEYPAPYNTVNLLAMDTLKVAFKTTVGYSDHTEGIAISVAAVAKGARIIEKHFTLDRKMPGPDHLASIEPKEFQKMVESIRQVEIALGDGIKNIQASEIETQKVVKKGIYATEHIPSGTVITEYHLVGKRPNKGIGIEHYETIIGKQARTDISKGHPIFPDNISWE